MKRNRVVPKTVKLEDAAFVYISTCCEAVATKPACAVPRGERIGTHVGAVPDPDKRNLTLGSWRCSICKKPCKCRRAPKKEVVPTPSPETFTGVAQ